jgi:DUF1009 family protein
MTRAEAPLGIIAGRGRFPLLLAERLAARGRRVVIAALAGQFGQPPQDRAVPFRVFPIGAFGDLARYLIDHGVRTAYLAGGVRRRGAWRFLRPDRHSLGLIALALLGGDDGLLRAVADRLAGLGVEIGDPRAHLVDLLPGPGQLAGPLVGAGLRAELAIAWRAARAHGRRDRGQAALVFRGRVVGREGPAGTDALLASAPGPGAVLAKVVKPGQDRRFDLPAIGPSTLRVARAVGLAGIAVEAGGVLLVEPAQVRELADRFRIALVAWPAAATGDGGRAAHVAGQP